MKEAFARNQSQEEGTNESKLGFRMRQLLDPSAPILKWEAPHVVLEAPTKQGEPVISFQDGRHWFSVLCHIRVPELVVAIRSEQLEEFQFYFHPKP